MITERTFTVEPMGWVASVPDRIIGQKGILAVFEPLYGIRTWPGAIKFIRANNLPLRRTPSNRPMFLKHELVGYESKFMDAIK